MVRLERQVLDGISIFAAVVDAGTFVAAGDRLGMSQSGVSRAVARLEDRLKVRLFDRTTRTVSLTDEGRRFLERVTPLMSALEDTLTSASEGSATIRGRLRVCTDPVFSRLIAGPALAAFLKQYPDLELDLMARDQLGDLVADGFDLAIRFGEPPPSSLVARKLMETRVLTVAAPSYLKRAGRPDTPHDIMRQHHTTIEFRDPQSGQPYRWEFHKRSKVIALQTNGRLTVNDPNTMLHACLQGYGIAQILEVGYERLLAQGSLVELFPDWSEERFPLYAFLSSRHHVPAKTRAFLDFAVSVTSTPR